jgi:mannose-6-phosphate isomerase-like protein (cupin superfamily)
MICADSVKLVHARGGLMKKAFVNTLTAIVVFTPMVALSQESKAKPTTATYITKEEVDIVNSTPGVDREIKVVDIGHENYAVGVVHRGKTANGVAERPASATTPAAAARSDNAAAPAPTPCGRQMDALPAGGTSGGITHDHQTEGYYIVSGGGTMFTDGYIVNGRHTPSVDLNGPSCGGMAYDVVKKVVKPGDIVIVPAGVVHGWLDIPDHVDYLSFRPSPGILTAGWVNPALKK